MGSSPSSSLAKPGAMLSVRIIQREKARPLMMVNPSYHGPPAKGARTDWGTENYLLDILKARNGFLRRRSFHQRWVFVMFFKYKEEKIKLDLAPQTFGWSSANYFSWLTGVRLRRKYFQSKSYLLIRYKKSKEWAKLQVFPTCVPPHFFWKVAPLRLLEGQNQLVEFRSFERI